MRRLQISCQSAVLIVLAGLLGVFAPKPAGADAIVVQSDFQECLLFDTTFRQHTVTVLHRFNVGARAVRFKIETSPTMLMTYVSETHAWPSTLGDMRNGISVCYGSCVSGDVVLGTITYQGYGSSQLCAEILVKPHPNAETLDIVTCENDAETAQTFHFEVLGFGSSGCALCNIHDPGVTYPGDPHTFVCGALPVVSSTWGAIKSLYR